MSNDGWNGKFSNLRVSEGSFPELHEELSPLNHKDRCDRMRVLAMIGLYSLKGTGVAAGAVESKALETKESSASESKNVSAKSELKNKLLGSVVRG